MFCGKLTFIILVSSLVQIFNLEIFCVAIFCFRAGDKRGQYWLPNRGSGLGLNKLRLLLPTTFLPQIHVPLLQVAFALLIFLTVAHPRLPGHLSPSVLIVRKSFYGSIMATMMQIRGNSSVKMCLRCSPSNLGTNIEQRPNSFISQICWKSFPFLNIQSQESEAELFNSRIH